MTASLTTVALRCGALAAAGVLALTACSSSGSTGAPADPPTSHPVTSPVAAEQDSSTASGPASSSPGTTATTAAHQVHVCDLLPAATLARLSGVPVTHAKADDQPAPAGIQLVISRCNYTDAGTNQISVTYSRNQFVEHQFQQDYSIDKSVISRTAMVSGIGDKAFTADFASAWLEVLWDGATYKVDGGTPLSVAQAERIVTALHGKV